MRFTVLSPLASSLNERGNKTEGGGEVEREGERGEETFGTLHWVLQEYTHVMLYMYRSALLCGLVCYGVHEPQMAIISIMYIHVHDIMLLNTHQT